MLDERPTSRNQDSTGKKHEEVALRHEPAVDRHPGADGRDRAAEHEQQRQRKQRGQERQSEGQGLRVVDTWGRAFEASGRGVVERLLSRFTRGPVARPVSKGSRSDRLRQEVGVFDPGERVLVGAADTSS